jgi:hypothetical protein
MFKYFLSFFHFQFTVNSELYGIKASRIFTQPTKMSKKFYYFYKAIQQQIYEAHKFTHHTIVLPAALPTILPHADVITAKAN